MTNLPAYETANYSMHRCNNNYPDLRHRFYIYDKNHKKLVSDCDNGKYLGVYRSCKDECITRINELEK